MDKTVKKILQMLALSLALLTVTNASAQQAKMQSIYIYNFTKFVIWPPSANNSEFVIAVVGGIEVTKEIEAGFADKMTVDHQKLVIRKFKTVAEAAKTTARIVYISQEESAQFDTALQLLKNKPVLLVTDQEGLSQKGSAINFVVVEAKQRFELNRYALKEAGLKVSTNLSDYAIIVGSSTIEAKRKNYRGDYSVVSN
jgi:hypothetical protein